MSLFVLQLRGELYKLFARKRTYIGFGAFLVVEMAVLFLLRLGKVQAWFHRIIDQAGYDSDGYLSGLTMGIIMLSSTILILGALYLALVSGDVVSKEVEDGTLRMMLCRPVSRGRILLLKIIACACYSVALTVFIATTAVAAGYLYGGRGGVFIWSPMEGVFALYDFWPGFQRYLIAIPLLALSLFTVSSIGFFFSCLNMKPAAATILTLSVLFIDFVLKVAPFFESLHGWFLNSKMSAWIHVFDYRVPWESMTEDYAWLMAINATLLIIGWQAFEQRDFKS